MNVAILHKKSRGQGLIETLVTLLIIAVSIIALVRFQNRLVFYDSLVQQQADATLLAINKLESLRDFTALNTTTGLFAYQDITSGSQTITGTTTTYTMTWSVTTLTNPDYKVIDVAISWQDRDGKTQSKRWITRVAKVDPLFSATIMST